MALERWDAFEGNPRVAAATRELRPRGRRRTRDGGLLKGTSAFGVISFPALGTTATVWVTDRAELPRAERQVRKVVERFDRSCSRFRADSDLTLLNAAAGRWTAISPTLCDAIAAALWAANVSDGRVDPTVGAGMVATGYDRTLDEVRDVSTPVLPVLGVPAAGWRSVHLDRGSLRAMLPPGCVLDLGATAKALAADHASTEAVEAAGGESGVAVSLGGDVALAGPPPAGGWQIGVAEHHAGTPTETVSMRSGGIATSSTIARRWRRGERTIHHLLDPNTGEPVSSSWRTATVAAASCLEANIAATAAVILSEAAPDWLQDRGLPARLIAQGGTIRTTARWAA